MSADRSGVCSCRHPWEMHEFVEGYEQLGILDVWVCAGGRLVGEPENASPWDFVCGCILHTAPPSDKPAGFDFPKSAERGCDVSGKEAARNSLGQPAQRLFDPGPAGPEFDTMIPYTRAECGVCRLAGPDSFGNYDLLEVDVCPVHGWVT